MPQFDDQSAKRISRAVRGWERRQQGRRAQRGRWQGHSTFGIFTCQLTENLLPGDSAAATLLTGATKSTNGGVITVKDVPTSITTGKMIASGTKCRIFKDPDMGLAKDEYAFLLPFACEVTATGSGS